MAVTKEQRRIYNRTFFEKHPEKRSEYSKRFKALHPEKVKEYGRRERAKRCSLLKAIDIAMGVDKNKRTPEQQKRHEYYLKHRAEYLARAKKHTESMTPDEREAFNKKHREYKRKKTQTIQEARELGII